MEWLLVYSLLVEGNVHTMRVPVESEKICAALAKSTGENAREWAKLDVRLVGLGCLNQKTGKYVTKL